MSAIPVQISPATPSDVPTLVAFIRALAAFEHLSEQCLITEPALHEHLFASHPVAEALIARLDDHPVGYALFFPTFSTFAGKPGIWLEDLFVIPESRHRGIGTALLRHVAQLAHARRCGRLEWSVLDWNAPAIALYRRMGADMLPDWRICRVVADKLKELGTSA